MDLDIYTARPEATCRACRAWDDGTPIENPPDHTCRTPPTIPRTTTGEQARADDRVLAAREAQVRQLRLVELRRGYA
jgi:hypothetical protein